MLIGYTICFETEKDYVKVGPFFDVKPINDKRIEKELKLACDSDMLELDPSEILDFVVIAMTEDEVQFFELNPADFWPLKIESTSDFKFYHKKGGEKD